MARAKTAGKRQEPNALFHNKSNAKPSQLPPSAIRELIGYGIPEASARAFGWSMGWAILYRYRNGGSPTEEKRKALRAELATRLEATNRDDDSSTRELIDLASEALAILDEREVRRVVAGLHRLLLGTPNVVAQAG